MVIVALFSGIVLVIVVVIMIMTLLPSYRDKPKIFLFKKIDLLVQHILVAMNILCLISVIFWIMFIVLLPLLGLVQIFSIACHIYFKELTSYHKTYLKVLAGVSIVSAIAIFLFFNYYIVVLMILGFSMGIYYWIVSMKTIKTIYTISDDTLENQ